jgi:hypothetical protein
MSGRANGSPKLENTALLMPFLMCQSQLSQTSENWEILHQICLKDMYYK